MLDAGSGAVVDACSTTGFQPPPRFATYGAGTTAERITRTALKG